MSSLRRLVTLLAQAAAESTGPESEIARFAIQRLATAEDHSAVRACYETAQAILSAPAEHDKVAESLKPYA